MKQEPEDFFNDDQELNELVRRFEEMLSTSVPSYFDPDEIADIIDYYFFNINNKFSLKAIELGLEQFPENILFRLKKAQYYATFDKAEKALELLTKIGTTPDDDYEVYLVKATIFSLLKKYKEAIDEYKKAIDKADNLDEIYANIAYEYQNLGNFEKALDYAKKSLLINPEQIALIYELSMLYEITSKYQEGLDFFKDFTDKYPFHKEAWLNYGILAGNYGSFDLAIDSFDYCIAIDDKITLAYINKANCFLQIDKFQDAINTYNEVIELEEPTSILYCYIAECYFRLDDFETTEKYYNKAIKLNDKNPEAWMGLGILFEKYGNNIAALNYFYTAKNIDNENPDYLFFYASSLFKNNRKKEAIDAYYKAISIDETHIEARIELAKIYNGDNNIADAILILKEGIGLNISDDIDLKANIFVYLYRYQQNDAITLLHEILQEDAQCFEAIFEIDPTLENDSPINDIIQLYQK